MAVCTKCGQTTGELGRVLRESIALGAEVGAALLVLGRHIHVRDARWRYSEDRGPVPYWDGLVERLDAPGVRPPVWKYLVTMPATTYATGATDGQ